MAWKDYILLAPCEGNPPDIGGFPSWRPVMQFWFFLCCRLNMLLNKQSSCWWFEMPWCSCDVSVMRFIMSISAFGTQPHESVKQMTQFFWGVFFVAIQIDPLFDTYSLIQYHQWIILQNCMEDWAGSMHEFLVGLKHEYITLKHGALYYVYFGTPQPQHQYINMELRCIISQVYFGPYMLVKCYIFMYLVQYITIM